MNDTNKPQIPAIRWANAGLLAMLAALALFATGCVHSHSRSAHHSHTKVVTLEKGHVHTVRCGHYRHQGRWYHAAGHVHGKRCGHVKVRGVWVVRR
ncbi:MAG: hypothetical protein MPN21_23985 [Thermoanaerobaculia bacterium]|nr:hypothetical protein [Thermoanaerobaculia bacterium]